MAVSNDVSSSLLNADELRAKLEETERKRGVEYVSHLHTKDLYRVDRAEKESMADHVSALEAKIATLEKELAAARAKEAQKDSKILALESEFRALGLGTQTTTTLYVHLPA